MGKSLFSKRKAEKKLVFFKSLCYNPKMTVIVVVRPFLRDTVTAPGIGSAAACKKRKMYMIFIYIKEENSDNECTGRELGKEHGEAHD